MGNFQNRTLDKELNNFIFSLLSSIYRHYPFHNLDAHNIDKYGLKKGDIGAVVHIYKEGKALEVEFVTATGKTVALITLTSSDVRDIKQNDILHVRGFAHA